MKNRRLLLFLSLFMLIGCQRAQVTPVALSKNVVLSVYTVEGCGRCDAFETYGVPYLQASFGDQITVVAYDLDEDEARYRYEQTIKRLVDYDQADYGLTPFIVVEDHFALLGYQRGDEALIVHDIVQSVRGDELGEELKSQRFLYLEEE